MPSQPDRQIRVLEVLEATGGGTRRHLNDVVLGLDRDRFEVSVACALGREPDFENDIRAMREAGHRVDLVPMVRPIRPFSDLRALLKLRNLLRRCPVDIVHTHSAKAGILGRLAARMTGVRHIVHTPHHFPFDMDVSMSSRGLYLIIEKIAASFTSRIICVCPQERASARRRNLAPPERLVVIENGIPLEGVSIEPGTDLNVRRELNLTPDNLLVGVIGRFCKQKGQCYLIDAIPEIRRRVPEAVFLFIGGGEDRDALMRCADQRGIADACRFIEHQEDINVFHRALDLLVMPSLWEGLPYTLLESMAAGTPVAAFETGGITDVIDNRQNGLLAPRKDTAALAEAVCTALTDPELRRRLASNARRTVAEHYHLDDMIADIEQLYMILVKPDGKAGRGSGTLGPRMGRAVET